MENINVSQSFFNEVFFRCRIIHVMSEHDADKIISTITKAALESDLSHYLWKVHRPLVEVHDIININYTKVISINFSVA